MTKALLHIEGLAVSVSAVVVYGVLGYSWWLFIVLLMAPDVSMLGYLQNKKVGAYVYNVFHTYVLTLLTIGFGYFASIDILTAIGIIWTAHIGMDRSVGFGLKYTDRFQLTHLTKIKGA